ncbi:MAG: bifunctional 3-deoxy-7-phosphoheptulonate synthase/chorismate mutase type II, partial [Bacteroidota bacterium]|nr:bifunctional 3-deoxy-7-phosphoheptulonate synthase/chorismate mutase type II [Bacteroidota bacterium]
MKPNINCEPIANWGVKNAKPLIIAGPCSAESEEQMVETARGMDLTKVSVFRAGIWKPRTRPNMFEGVGPVGLQWLKTVKQETGLLTATEVANVKHVYEALKAGIDMIWIGARTTTNPFAVQEIADALQGVDIPVLIKNPINPDVELWIGAIERIARAGITKLGAIHRGFSRFEKSAYRNPPHWQLPLDLRRALPNLPLICDPSHIAGTTSLLEDIAQRAFDLSYDGLIIETHCNPSAALSDAKQQITPYELTRMLGRLALRSPETSDPAFRQNLEELRGQIDKLDVEIIRLMGTRMRVSEEIGKFKKNQSITIFQAGRWDEIMNKS